MKCYETLLKVLKACSTTCERHCFPCMHSIFKSMITPTLRLVVRALQAGTCYIKKSNNLWIQLRVNLVWAMEVSGILFMLHGLIGQSRQHVIRYIAMPGISSIFLFFLLSVQIKSLQLHFFTSLVLVKPEQKRLNLIDTYTKSTYWKKKLVSQH